MVKKSKDSQKLSAIQAAVTAGFHLDNNEALALIKRGFFAEKNKQRKTAKHKNVRSYKR